VSVDMCLQRSELETCVEKFGGGGLFNGLAWEWGLLQDVSPYL